MVNERTRHDPEIGVSAVSNIIQGENFDFPISEEITSKLERRRTLIAALVDFKIHAISNWMFHNTFILGQ